jgi:uncharacterized membrane protein YfcA
VTATGDEAAPADTRTVAARSIREPLWLVFLAGASVGVLGGLVGLGGAEFRLPLLLAFGFAALAAVIVNKSLSLVVVLSALPARLTAVPLDTLAAHWFVAGSLLLGSLPGAWLGAAWATRMRAATLHRVLGVLLLAIAGVFAAHHLGWLPHVNLPLAVQVCVGAVAGVGVGLVSALLGVAGGELLVPLITVLFAVDVKLAGSLSLVVSLPTMLLAFGKYAQGAAALALLRQHARFIVTMAAGSVAGSVTGGLLLGVVPTTLIVPLVIALLLISAVKVWRYA